MERLERARGGGNATGTTFAVYSGERGGPRLCLYDEGRVPERRASACPPTRSSGMWHGRSTGVPGRGTRYWLNRVHGPWDPWLGPPLQLRPKLLLDPYSPCALRTVQTAPRRRRLRPPGQPTRRRRGPATAARHRPGATGRLPAPPYVPRSVVVSEQLRLAGGTVAAVAEQCALAGTPVIYEAVTRARVHADSSPDVPPDPQQREARTPPPPPRPPPPPPPTPPPPQGWRTARRQSHHLRSLRGYT
jgi:hypothetical protein